MALSFAGWIPAAPYCSLTLAVYAIGVFAAGRVSAWVRRRR